MISLLDIFATVTYHAPFHVDCPWCGHKSMDQQETGKSKTGVHETLFWCPECSGSRVHRWIKEDAARHFPAREGIPNPKRLREAIALRKSRTDSSAQEQQAPADKQ